MKNSQISIYIHWPFCKSLCPYCDFNSHLSDGHIDYNKWLRHYLLELEYFKNHFAGKYIKSIFIGGGTPSLMSPTIIEGIISYLARYAVIDLDSEITMEANPTSYETSKFKQFKAAGVNRISLGVQALNDNDLKLLGREHSASEAIKTIHSASDIFDRYSFDIIYARLLDPANSLSDKQRLKNWQAELQEAINLSRDHISLYQLTIEKGTKFYSDFKLGKITMPSNDFAADIYQITDEMLAASNLYKYEISNYSKMGGACRHNLAYWHYDEYLGVGPGAHSRLKINGHLNSLVMQHLPRKWLESISTKSNAILNQQALSKNEMIEEFLMMNLRLTEGISNSNCQAKLSMNIFDIIDKNIANAYADNGFVYYDEDNFRLTNKGLMMHSYIVARLIKE